MEKAAINVESTNFEFDIEANRRRRAEIASDVTELLNISKFFLHNYSGQNHNAEQSLQQTKNSQPNTGNNIRPKQKGYATANSKRQSVAIATPPCDTCKQIVENGTNECQLGKPTPPLGDQNKLHEYCVNIVEEFFARPMTSRSVGSKSAKQISHSGDKWIQRMKQVTNQYSTEKMQKNPRYASISPRYLTTIHMKRAASSNERIRLFPPNSLITEKSRQILAKIVRKGSEIKKHSCLMNDTEAVKKGQGQRARSASAERHPKPFSEIYPNIELVQSNSVFPKRVLKQSNTSSARNRTHSLSFTASTQIMSGGRPRENTVNLDRNANQEPHSGRSLQLRQLPSLSIEPRAQCKVENVFAIEIKGESKDVPISGGFLRKNEVHEFVYESTHSESISDGDREESTSHLAPPHEEHLTNGQGNRNLSTIDETNPHDEVEKSLDSHCSNDSSQNTSSVSLLTDDEKSRTESRLHRPPANQSELTTTEETNIDETIGTRRPRRIHSAKNPVRVVIDEILESEEVTKPDEANSLDNLDDFRETLQRIRDDQTTMDVELKKHQQRTMNANIPTTSSAHTEKPIESTRQMQDQGIQCDSLSSKAHSIDDRGLMHLNQVPAQCNQFHENSSFRGSSIDSAELSIYRGATRKQVQRAAKNFLRSILEDSESPSKDDCDDSSCINLKIERQKYVIVEDRLMRSRLNVMPEHDSEESTSNEMPSIDWNVTSHPGNGNWFDGKRHPSNGSWTNGTHPRNGNWNEDSYSDTDPSTENSVNISFGRRAMAYQDTISVSLKQRRQQQQQQHPKQPKKPQSYMSEGEILSDGEARYSS